MTVWTTHERCANRSPLRGYILAEVIVSMVVLTVGIVSVSRSFSVALIARGLAQDYTDSRYLAAGQMWKTVADAEAGKLKLGSKRDKFPAPWQKFSWELTVEETTIPYKVLTGVAGNEQAATFFARAVLTIKWTRRNVEYERWVATIVPPVDLLNEKNQTS
jgi:hypothetical protein